MRWDLIAKYLITMSLTSDQIDLIKECIAQIDSIIV